MAVKFICFLEIIKIKYKSNTKQPLVVKSSKLPIMKCILNVQINDITSSIIEIITNNLGLLTIFFH